MNNSKNKTHLKKKGIRILYTIGLATLVTTSITACDYAAQPVQQETKTVMAASQQPNNQQKVKDSRSNYHFTVPDNWKNDPQRPIYAGGKYHYYYLYNKDYPKGNGTEWRHATSTDLMHWKDHGVAIPKYTNANGDPWSGSVVVDTNNTAGFGTNSMIAIVTQPSADGGAQEQYLWYSTDGGQRFHSYSSKPILSNPGNADFRDPKLVWDRQSSRWIMLMAEGNRVGFYTSKNLKSWHYVSDFVTDDIGTLECPDLYRMKASDGTYKWVLGVSANGRESGNPNTYAYWTGKFNGKTFTTDQKQPKWLDYGFDWYAAVTFEDGTSKDKYGHRYALAWMNNWDYADNTPTRQDGFNGTDSMVRQIQLKQRADGYALISQPIRQLGQYVKATKTIPSLEVDGAYTLNTKGQAYQLDADISWSNLQNAGFRLRESSDGKRHVDAGVFVEGGYTYVNRAYTGHPDENDNLLESRSPFDKNQKKVHLKILVDKNSIEMFVDGGKVTMTNLIFPKSTDQGITLYTQGGKALFENIVIKYLGQQ